MTDQDTVDELFGEGSGQPVPRIRLVLSLLVGGMVLAILGMACTAAPGGLMVLVAWMVIEKELDRVESGYFPTDVKPRLLAVQRATYAGVMVVVLLFVVQLLLLCGGTYEVLWGRLLMMLPAP